MKNLHTYEKSHIVEWYAGLDYIFEAEKKIFSIVKESVSNVEMLDIGVGAGRTTRHLAPLCARYVGVDYSETMVQKCKELFPYEFAQADARNLRGFSDNSFDLVLFSFNGIDSVPYEDRAEVFREVRRVSRGYFGFSAHNIASLPKIFSWNPKGNLAKYFIFYCLRHIVNFPISQIAKRDYAEVTDGFHRFGIKNGYIRPSKQISDLQRAGFTDIQMLEVKTGANMTPDEWRDEIFHYYLCRC